MPSATLARLMRVQGAFAFVAGFVDVTGDFGPIEAELARGSSAGVFGKVLALPVLMLAFAIAGFACVTLPILVLIALAASTPDHLPET